MKTKQFLVLSLLSVAACMASARDNGGGLLQKLMGGVTVKQTPSSKQNDPSKWRSDDVLTVEQAKARYATFFSLKATPNAVFIDSPFEGWFVMMIDNMPANVFNADISTTGLYHTWNRREGEKLVPLTDSEVQEHMQQLRKRVKAEAVIPAWQNNSVALSKDTPVSVIFTAPNCPSCLKADANLNRLNSAVKTNIVFVPEILSRDEAFQQGFTESMMCSANPQGAFKTAFVNRGRGQFSVAGDCKKGWWPNLIAMAFYPSLSKEKDFQKDVSFPGIFRSDGKRVSSATVTEAKTAKEIDAALTASN